MSDNISKITTNPKLFFSIGDDGPDLGGLFTRFEWSSFVNSGYIIRGTILDPMWDKLREFAVDKDYLKEGRRQPTKVVYELSWPGGPDLATGKHMAYITDANSAGIPASGNMEFIAVDPPSYWLNAGDSAGSVYKGAVHEVIRDVVTDYFLNPNENFDGGDVKVSKTIDNKQNTWWMMRMDPKTFIRSLIDWSSSITEKKTNWLVTCDGAIENGVPSIWFKEQGDRTPVNYGTYIVDVQAPTASDTPKLQYMGNNSVALFQRQVITQGISAVSERYFDREMDTPPHTGKEKQCIVHVHDENTDQKWKAKIGEDKGFTKPGTIESAHEIPHEWSTSILAIPQFNAGDLGITYDKYIDGRARQTYIDLLSLAMRIKVRVTGESSKVLANSHNLGVSKLKLAWIRSADGQPYFLGGDWLVYGFHHIVTRTSWTTDLYCIRYDFDSSARPA